MRRARSGRFQAAVLGFRSRPLRLQNADNVQPGGVDRGVLHLILWVPASHLATRALSHPAGGAVAVGGELNLNLLANNGT